LAPLDLAPLFARLFRDDCTWVVHSARQDLEVIFQRTERLPPRLVDTQVAAGLTGCPPQIGLEALLSRTVQVELGESFARTDWSRRPLPEAALRYALDDVRYLLPAWRILEAQLSSLRRLDWLHEDSTRILAERPVADPLAIWSRLKGVYGLPFTGQCAALGLVRWRERAAQRSNRPRRWLLADDVLLALAARLPAGRADLEPLLPARFAAKFGAELLAAVAQRDDAELQALVRANSGQPPTDKARLKALQESVRQHAARLGIEPEILATRRDLTALAAGSPPPHLRSGWRATELKGLAPDDAAPRG
jgi:ribonuclease D